MTWSGTWSRDSATGLGRRGRRVPRSLVWFLAGAAVVLGVVRPFVVEPYEVLSDSMRPTLAPGNTVLIDKTAYRRGTPARNDIVLLADPEEAGTLIKRVVGTGGDVVAIEDGRLTVNGAHVSEPYVDHDLVDGVYFMPVEVPRDQLFVLGDARWVSRDSRDFGAVPSTSALGRVVAGRALPEVLP